MHQSVEAGQEMSEREILFARQRAERGFADDELWSLDLTIAQFVLPRLKAFKAVTTSLLVPADTTIPDEFFVSVDKSIPNEFFKKFEDGIFPINETEAEIEWGKTLDDMIAAFEIVADEANVAVLDESQWETVQKGLQAFAKNFRGLWY